jgi:anti-sigma B factor antagonist
MKLKRSTGMLRVNPEQRAWKGSAPGTSRIRRKCVNLALTTRTVGDVAVVQAGGSLVFQREAAALCDVVTKLIDRYRTVVVDMNGVSSIDGSGLGTLAECIRNAKQAGAQLILCSVPAKVKKLLDLTQLSSLVEIVDSESEALERVRTAA